MKLISSLLLIVVLVLPSSSCDVVLGVRDDDGETGEAGETGEPGETGAHDETGETGAHDETGETGDADPCELDPEACAASCGNDIVEPGEACDGGPCCASCALLPNTEVCAADLEGDLACPWGTAAGSDVGVRTRDRYCSGERPECDGELVWSEWEASEDCQGSDGCREDLQACGCAAGSAWEPVFASAFDTKGSRYENGMLIPVPETHIGVEFSLSDAPGQLRVRVCKQSELLAELQNTVYLRIADAQDRIMFEGELERVAETECSEYAELEHDEDFAEGQAPVGSWFVVSPSTSAPEWQRDCTPATLDAPTGFCWWRESLPAMLRTCWL